MGILENILKEAEAQVANPAAKPEDSPVVKSASTEDITKFANFTKKVGELYKLGQEPAIEPALVPPVGGTQVKAEGEAKTVTAPTKPKPLGTGGEVANNEATPVVGVQQEAADTPKVAEWRLRMRKVATGLMQSDAVQDPGNVGLTAPAPDQTGFPDDAQKLTAVSTHQVEKAKTVIPMTPLLAEKPKTSDEEMKAALPQATASPATTASTVGDPTKTAELSKEAAEESMGRIAAHAFLDELTSIHSARGE